MQVDFSDALQVKEWQQQFTSKLRDCMSKGVEFGQHNPYQQGFFKQVIHLAGVVNSCVLHHSSEDDIFF
jgi:hypothetical protein